MWRFVALFIALVAGIGVAVWYYRSPEAGTSVRVARNDDRWIDGLQSRTPKEAEAAAAEVERRGTTALPTIRKILQDPAADPPKRKAALKAIGILGARAAEAIPDVAALLPDADYTTEAALALSFMGSAAVRPLRDATQSEHASVRREALRSLGKLRERASIDPQLVVPLLLKALEDDDPTVRHVAVTYLGIVRDNPPAEIAGLIDALEDEEADVREAAAIALGQYGALADQAVPALRKAARDSDEEVRREAGRALVTIAEKKKPAA